MKIKIAEPINLQLSRLVHKFDHLCKECGEVRVTFWKDRCSFCDSGEGKLNAEKVK